MRKKWFLPSVYVLVAAGMLLFPYWGSRTVTVLSQGLPIARSHCIVIDAGHGGIDGGATSRSGVLESALNLEIALRMNDLCHFLGYETKMIRTTDQSIHTKDGTIAQKKISDLKERVRIVNETENAVLLSIHQNNFPEERYHGAQVFYSAAGDSAELAEAVQAAMVQHLNPGSNRQIKKASGVYLMEHIQRTGILIECGFLSNAREEQFLRSADYQKKLSAVIVTTVCTFLSNT